MSTRKTDTKGSTLPAPPNVKPKTDTQWKALLTPEQYASLRGRKIEKPYHYLTMPPPKVAQFNSATIAAGDYACMGCNTALFPVKAKNPKRTEYMSFPSGYKGALKITVIVESFQTLALCCGCEGFIGVVSLSDETGEEICNANSTSLVWKAASSTTRPVAVGFTVDLSGPQNLDEPQTEKLKDVDEDSTTDEDEGKLPPIEEDED